MALRSEKDRAKAQQEKFQAILSALLKDEDNKYCEDCDAKGPRWASWNLGIFLCIRCAGIHRNLGVHISRVKSVNLDSWTPEQVAMMQEMGNSRARAVYEANVPDSFRRPQTDSALEAFIRAKYEQKKYIAKEWVPPKPVVPKEWLEDDKADKRKARSKPTTNISLSSGPPSAQPSAPSTASSGVKASAAPAAAVAADPKPTQPQPPAPKPKSSSDDLLGLDAEVPQTGGGGGGQGGDLLADIFGGSQTASANQGQPNLMANQQNGATEPILFDSGTNGSGEGQGEKKSAKDSIMALYGSGGGQQQMFGVPGYYVGQYAVANLPTGSSSSAVSTPVGTGGMTVNGGGVFTSPPAGLGTMPSSTSGLMGPPAGQLLANPGLTAAGAGVMAVNPTSVGPNPGMMGGNVGLMPANTGMASFGSGLVSVNSGMMGAGPGMMATSSGMLSGSSGMMSKPAGFTPQKPEMNLGMPANQGMTAGTGVMSKPGPFPQHTWTGLQAGRGQTVDKLHSMPMTPKFGGMMASAGLSTNTKSVASHSGSVSASKPQAGSGLSAGAMTNTPVVYGGAELYQVYGAASNPYYFMAPGGMYMPQQQMYGAGGMPSMPQQPQGMMGMQPGMMGQPMQQGMMGMQQQPGGAMMGAGGSGPMGQGQMGGNMMGAAQGGLGGRPGGQMFMQQPQVNPMQQQMQFQQMQQQMANMSVGAGQMGGMQQQPQQAAVGGGSWGGTDAGHTLSTNLWQ